MRPGATIMAAMLAASAGAGAAPPLTGTFDPNHVPTLPPGPIPLPKPDPALFDTLAAFDYTGVPLGGYKPPVPADPAAQQLVVPSPSYVMITQMADKPQQHALHLYGITWIDPQPMQFRSQLFTPAKRNMLTVTWDGAFALGDTYNSFEMRVTLEGFADLAVLAFRKGQVSVVTNNGYQPFATYDPGPPDPGAPKPPAHHVVVACGALSHQCTATFAQGGKTSTSAPFVLASSGLMPTPAGKGRLALRIGWPKQEASSVHAYNVRRVTIGGDAPGAG